MFPNPSQNFINLLDKFLLSPQLSKHVSKVSDITDLFDYHPSLDTSRLGKGSYGEVYRMRRKSDGNVFAIKFMEKARVCRSNDSVQHVMVEVLITTSLGRQEGFTHCEAVYHSVNCVFFVMECIEGKCPTDQTLNRLYRYHLRHDTTPKRSEVAMVEKVLGDLERKGLHQIFAERADTDPADVLQKELAGAVPEVQEVYRNTVDRAVSEYFKELLDIHKKKEPPFSGDMFTYIDTYRQVPKEKVLVIFKSLLETLHFLHMRQVVHRDIKPENVMVVEHRHMTTTKRPSDGRKVVTLYDRVVTKVVDFGLSKVMNAPCMTAFPQSPSPFVQGMVDAFASPEAIPFPMYGSAPITVTPCGTELYSACEAIDGILRGNLGQQKWHSTKDSLPKLDMWAAGVILFCLYYGRLPFRIDQKLMPRTLDRAGQRRWRLEKLKQLVAAGLVIPGGLRDDVPPEAIELMKLLTSQDEGKRPTAAEALKHPYLRDFHGTDTVVYELVFSEDCASVEEVNVSYQNSVRGEESKKPSGSSRENTAVIVEEVTPAEPSPGLDDVVGGGEVECIGAVVEEDIMGDMRELAGEGNDVKVAVPVPTVVGV